MGRPGGKLKSALRAAIALTPYRLVRGPENRFQAIEYTLSLLRTFGYAPRLVIDGGAHLGTFAEVAARIFPTAEIYMIEPQAACQPALAALTPRFHLHPVALGSAADVATGLNLAAGDTPSTGAHIAAEGQPVAVAALDDLFNPTGDDRTLLKMDLQGYELQALKGAERLLGATEVILTEVSFFAQAYEPPVLTLMNYLDARGFGLFDVAALAGRTRDNRLKQGDLIFVRRGSPAASDTRWA